MAERQRAVIIDKVSRRARYVKLHYSDTGQKFYKALLRIWGTDGRLKERASRKDLDTASGARDWAVRHSERYQRLREAMDE